MLYTVEVRLIGGDFVGSLTQMRTWLDHRRIEPDAFRHSAGGAGVTFRVEFKIEAEALQFASAFGGRLIGQLGDAALWPSSAGNSGTVAASGASGDRSKRRPA